MSSDHNNADVLAVSERLWTRFMQSGSTDDLDQIIRLLEDALPRTQRDRGVLPAVLSNLGTALTARHERLGRLADLERAIDLLQEASTYEDSRDQPRIRSNLAQALTARYELIGAPEDLEQAIRAARHALDATSNRDTGYIPALSNLLSSLRLSYERTGRRTDLEEVTELGERAATEALSEGAHRATLWSDLGIVYRELGRLEEAGRAYEQALDIFRSAGDRVGEARALSNSGIVYRELGRLEEAVRAYEQALDIFRSIDDQGSEVTALWDLGKAYQGLRRPVLAQRAFRQAVAISGGEGTMDEPSSALRLEGVPSSEAEVESEMADIANHLGASATRALRGWAASVKGSIRLAAPHVKATGHGGDDLIGVVLTRAGVEPVPLFVKVAPFGSHVRETERLRLAVAGSPRDFVGRHLLRPLFDPIPVDGELLLLQDVGRGSVNDYRPLSDLPGPDKVAACMAVVDGVLGGWNTSDYRFRSVAAATFLAGEWLEPVGRSRLTRWPVLASNLLSDDVAWVSTPEDKDPLPNPYYMATPNSPAAHCQIELLVGRAHGDLHAGNVLVPVDTGLPVFEDFTLIDLSTFEPAAPLARDPITLAVSIVAYDLRKLSPPGREALLDYLINGPDNGRLRNPTADAVDAIYDACARFFRLHSADWSPQRLLALQAVALLFASFQRVPRDARWWFFRLAAKAAAEFLRIHDMYRPADARSLDESQFADAWEASVLGRRGKAASTRLNDEGSPLSLLSPPRKTPRIRQIVAADPAAPAVTHVNAAYSAISKREVCLQLGAEWRDLADLLEIPSHQRTRFARGREPQAIWEWLEARQRLGELRGALRLIDRSDLVALLDADL